MTIYLDLIFILNFMFDLILLLTVKSILKRKCLLFRLILASLFGGITIFCLFIKMSSFELFIFKILTSIVMLIIAFGYQNISYFKKNIITLYICSIILGGFLYLLNLEFSYKHEGIVFFHQGLSINFIFLLGSCPIFLLLYVKEQRLKKQLLNNSYLVKINLFDKVLNLSAYLDTANTLIDPIFHYPVILLNEKYCPRCGYKSFLVPVHTINSTDTLKCLKINEIIIDEHVIKKKILVGFTKSFKIDNIDCLLNVNLMEDIC